MMPGGAGSQYSLSMRTSKTMPQLRYTRDDIQEQYTPTTNVTTIKSHQHQAQSSSEKKRQQQAQHHHRSPHDSGDELTDSTIDGENNGNYRSRSMQRKRQRRSRSASFFSGCFALPNTIRSRSILSHLGFATNSPSSHHHAERRDSRDSTNQGGTASGQRMSESKTLGNLQQISMPSPGTSNINMDPNSGFARKHVSFGSGRRGNQQQQHQQQQQSTDMTDDGSKGTPPKKYESTNEGTNVSNPDVIVNRGPHQQTIRHEQPSSQTAGSARVPQTTIAEAKNDTGRVMTGQHHHHQHQQQHQQSQPPIYLVSQVPGATLMSAAAAAASTSTTTTGVHMPAVLYQRPQEQSQFNYMGHQPPATMMPMQAIYHNHQPVHQIQQPLQCGPAVYVPPIAFQATPAPTTTTLYKRLPAAPMRTQSTQTDITAYHLMVTPPYGGSTTSSQAGSRPESCKRQQQQPQNIIAHSGLGERENAEAATASTSFSGSSPACSRLAKKNNDEVLKLEALSQASSSSSGDRVSRGQPEHQRQQQCRKPCQMNDDESFKSGESPLLGLSSETWSVAAAPEKGYEVAQTRKDSPGQTNGRITTTDIDSSGDDDDDNECGNLNASTLASSSSRSSSSASLVAHDSTLANTLVNYEPLKETMGESCSEDSRQKQRASIIISASSNIAVSAPPPSSSKSHSQPKYTDEEKAGGAETKLKFDNERDAATRDGPGPTGAAAVATAQVALGAAQTVNNSNNNIINNNSEGQIDPPSQFKDTRSKFASHEPQRSLQNDEEPLSLSEASSQTDPGLAQHIIDIGQSIQIRSSELDPPTQQLQLESGRSTPIASVPEQQHTNDTPTNEADQQRKFSSAEVSDIYQQQSQQYEQQNTNRRFGSDGRDNGDYRNVSEGRDTPPKRQASEDRQQKQVAHQPMATTTTKRALASPTEKRRDGFLTMDEFELALAASASPSNNNNNDNSNDGPTTSRQTKSTTSTLSTRHHSYCSSDDFNSTNIVHQPQQQQAAAADDDDTVESVHEEEEGKLIGANAIDEESRVRPPSQTLKECISYERSSLESANDERGPSLPICATGGSDDDDDEDDEDHGRAREKEANCNEEDIGRNKVSADPIPLVESSRAADAKEDSRKDDQQQRLELMAAANGPNEVAEPPVSPTIRRLGSGGNVAIESGAEPRGDGGNGGDAMAAADSFMITNSGHKSWSSAGEREDDSVARLGQDIVVLGDSEESNRARKSHPPFSSPVLVGRQVSVQSTSSSSSSGSSIQQISGGAKEEDKSRSTAMSAIRASTVDTVTSASSLSRAGSDAGGNSSYTGSAGPVPALGDRSPSVTSPPTTVSELDQDEELSTPTFVDSYRIRLGQVVGQFAKEFTEQLMCQSLNALTARGGGGDDDDTDFELIQWHHEEPEKQQPLPLRHKPPTPSGSSSSSSNNGDLSSEKMKVARGDAGLLSGNSSFSSPSSIDSSLAIEEADARKDLGAGAATQVPDKNDSSNSSNTTSDNSSFEDHAGGDGGLQGPSGCLRHAPLQPQSMHTTRPELPRKPAHLKLAAGRGSKETPTLPTTVQREGEAAAAIAVTATSIAAAAVRHSSYPIPLQVGVAHPLEIALAAGTAAKNKTATTTTSSMTAAIVRGQNQQILAAADLREAVKSGSEKPNEPKAITSSSEQTGSRSGSVCSTNSVIDASERRRIGQQQSSLDFCVGAGGDTRTASSQQVDDEIQSAAAGQLGSPTAALVSAATTTTTTTSTITSASSSATNSNKPETSLQATASSSSSHDNKSVSSNSCELERVEDSMRQEEHADKLGASSASSSSSRSSEQKHGEKNDLLGEDDIDANSSRAGEVGSDANEKNSLRHQLTTGASQELSTVSEVSEEMSQLLLQRQQQQQQQKLVTTADLPAREMSSQAAAAAPIEIEQGRRHSIGESKQSDAVTDLLATTEQDLANSEYTLRSWDPSSASANNMASAAVSEPADEPESCSVAARAAQQQHRLIRVHSREEQRRRSLGSGGSATSTSSVGCTARTLAGTKSPAFDCPYVHDIIPLSPPPTQPHAEGSGTHPFRLTMAGGDQQEPVVTRSIQRRLSHDDTMEAIEDDIEGEEQELREQQRQQQQQQQILDIEPPAAFGVQRHLVAPIREAEDEEMDEDEDEESSISVSQHGVIVSQEVGPSTSKRLKASSPSISMSSSSSSSSSPPPSTTSTQSNSRPPALVNDQIQSQAHYGDGAKNPETGTSRQSVSGDQKAASEPGESLQQQEHSKSNSTESATNAILDHLSRHHRDLTLDEPAPLLEQSRSVNPQLRRESWRRESRGSARHQTPTNEPTPPSAASASSSKDDERENIDPMNQPNTNTIKRGTKLSARSGSHEDSSSTAAAAALSQVLSDASHHSVPSTSDRPSLDSISHPQQAASQLEATKTPPLVAQQPQAQPSIPTDTSICSSCSCLEAVGTSIDHESFQEQTASTTTTAAAAAATATPSVTSPPAKKSGVEKTSETWMSQEEGTVFTENYWLSHWLYISEHEEAEIWRRAIDMNQGNDKLSHPATTDCSVDEQQTELSQSEGRLVASGMPKDMVEIESTSSERSFSSKYKSTTRKMIHRRATIEMYKRIANNNLKREKRVEISRSNGEFGFRIHGSRPVVVSAIERGTAAETCGLQVGDLIYAINGTNILDMAHSDVVKLAHSADSCSLVLDLVPTNDFLRMSKYNRSANKLHEPTVTGYLMRLSSSTAQPLLIELQEQMSKTSGVSSQQRAAKLTEVMRLAWRRRYFVLRSDNCLYWYRSPTDIEPYGGINLQGFSASLTNEFSEPSYVIRLVKYGGQPHYFGTNNVCDIQTWVDAINKAATEANQNDPYMKKTLTLARTKPSQIMEPDCCGYLYKFSHKKSGGAHWRAAFFVLKDACLFLFRDQQAETVNQASAVYYLHGYRVRTKQIEHKRHTFELIPPNRKTIRPMFLMANSEIDKKRWIAALEYSIDRWIEID